jgi:Protein of unknown function (DUF551)
MGKRKFEWQPIETVPRDGRAVLVMRDIWPGTESGRAEECNGHNTYVAAWWGSEWVCYMDQIQDPRCPIEPTHWMPLPNPPTHQTIPSAATRDDDARARFLADRADTERKQASNPSSQVQLCPSCHLPYSNGDTCPAFRGGCPMGGDF